MSMSSIFPLPTIQTGRVNQLDADLLDEELEHILVEPLWAALAPVLGVNWRPELMTLLKVIILRSSLEQSSTYGARLENLRWVNAKTKKSLSRNQITSYALLAVLPGYLKTRVRDYMLSSGWADYPSRPNWRSLLTFAPENRTRRNRYLKRALWDLSETLEQLHNSLGLLNFLLFLFNGKYRSVLERVLGISFVYNKLDLRRNVSFEFLNRQLIWESVTDFVLFILPFINFKRVQLRISDGASRLTNWVGRLVSDPEPNESGRQKGSEKPRIAKNEARFGKLSSEMCPICVTKRLYESKSGLHSSGIDPHDPMTFSGSLAGPNAGRTNHRDDRLKIAYQVDCCGGLYCYYCLVGEMIGWRENNLDRRWLCWRCGNNVVSMKRWNGGLSVP